jgi:glycosyltransferase involved in cell wall biosynthesis
MVIPLAYSTFFPSDWKRACQKLSSCQTESMKDRVVHVCYAGTSGASRVALNIAGGSNRPERHAYVFYGTCPLREDYAQTLRRLDVPFTYVPKPHGPGIISGRRVARAIVDFEPAAIVCHGSRTYPVLWHLCRLRCPAGIIAVQHGPDREITSPYRRWICRLFSTHADETVVVSAALARVIGRFPSLAMACEPVHVIPNGLDADFWHSPPRPFPTDRPLRLVMAATFSDYKDHGTLLRAAGRLRQLGQRIEIDLAGDGPTRKRMEALAVQLGLAEDAHFHGDQPTTNVRDLCSRADILVHTSHSESFALAVVEGMLAGKCVIATDCTGVDEILDHERTGLLIADGDDKALADHIRRLTADPEIALALATAAQLDAQQRFSHHALAQRYESLIDHLIARKQ